MEQSSPKRRVAFCPEPRRADATRSRRRAAHGGLAARLDDRHHLGAVEALREVLRLFELHAALAEAAHRGRKQGERDDAARIERAHHRRQQRRRRRLSGQDPRLGEKNQRLDDRIGEREERHRGGGDRPEQEEEAAAEEEGGRRHLQARVGGAGRADPRVLGQKRARPQRLALGAFWHRQSRHHPRTRLGQVLLVMRAFDCSGRRSGVRRGRWWR